MCTLISSACQGMGEFFGIAKKAPPVKHEESKAAQAMQRVIVAKQAHVDTALPINGSGTIRYLSAVIFLPSDIWLSRESKP